MEQEKRREQEQAERRLVREANSSNRQQALLRIHYLSDYSVMSFNEPYQELSKS